MIVLQEMTHDTVRLIETINSGVADGRTALYDAIMVGIQSMKLETGRRSLIVYTDGQDNESIVTPDAVIDSARYYNIPIYTIGLGDEVRANVLREIAVETGGIFSQSPLSVDMIAVYEKLLTLIQNFYVLAHASPDPEYNDTWRVVNVTVNEQGQSGWGAGRYYVPGPPKSRMTDLAIDLNIRSDNPPLSDYDTLVAVRPGESFEYFFSAENLGPSASDSAFITLLLPDSVFYDSSDISPISNNPDSLKWRLNNFEPSQQFEFSVFAHLSPKLPSEIDELISKAVIAATNDSNRANDVDFAGIRVLSSEPELEKYDLAIEQVAVTDTSIEIGGESVPAVIRGGSYTYRLVVSNRGPGLAEQVRLKNALPDSVYIVGFDTTLATPGDTLSYEFASLQSGDSIVVNFSVSVVDSLPFLPFPLENAAWISAEFDSFAANNVSTTTVYAVEKTDQPDFKLTDLALYSRAVTDSFRVTDGDTNEPFVRVRILISFSRCETPAEIVPIRSN